MSQMQSGSSNPLLRKKDIPTLQREAAGDTGMERTLGLWNLTAIGIGAIVGVGAFVLTGVVAANQAGPAVSLSFVVAGVINPSGPARFCGVGTKEERKGQLLNPSPSNIRFASSAWKNINILLSCSHSHIFHPLF